MAQHYYVENMNSNRCVFCDEEPEHDNHFLPSWESEELCEEPENKDAV